MKLSKVKTQAPVPDGDAKASYPAYKKYHLFSHYGPYSDSRRRHARNWLRDNLPAGSYKAIINTKRAIFGPHEGPYED